MAPPLVSSGLSGFQIEPRINTDWMSCSQRPNATRICAKLMSKSIGAAALHPVTGKLSHQQRQYTVWNCGVKAKQLVFRSRLRCWWQQTKCKTKIEKMEALIRRPRRLEPISWMRFLIFVTLTLVASPHVEKSAKYANSRERGATGPEVRGRMSRSVCAGK